MSRGALLIVILAVGGTAAFAAAASQARTEEARAVIAALEDVKASQRGPFLLSAAASGPGVVPHDSVLLSQIASVALHVVAAGAPMVLDTFVLTFAHPQRIAAGEYEVRAGGYLATTTPARGCYVGGPAVTYKVHCTGAECKAEVVSKATGSGRCQE